MRVLHFSAEPICDEALNISAELRSIADALLPGKVRHDTTLEAVPQTRPSDVDVYLANNQPHVVHFSMHGTPEGLAMCDAYLDKQDYSGAELAQALDGMNVKLVVLNTCESQEIAEAIKGKVDVVIATRKTLSDDHAIIFSETFYRSLQVGLTIEKSYNAAMRELDLVEDSASDWYLKLAEPGADNQKLIGLSANEAAEAVGSATVESSNAGGVEADQADMSATVESIARPPQHRMRAAAVRLESLRFGAAKEAGDNRRKLWTTLSVAFVLSLMAVGYPHLGSLIPAPYSAETTSVAETGIVRSIKGLGVDGFHWLLTAGSSDSNVECKADLACKIHDAVRSSIVRGVAVAQSLVGAFNWININVWLLFTFFVAPPAIYLVEYFWLKRPLEEAERAAFGLALKAPESLDPDEVVSRVEALVDEMDESNQGFLQALRGGKNDG